MSRSLLVLIPLSGDDLSLLRGDFDVVQAPDAASRESAIAAHASRFEAVLTNGTTGIAVPDLERMPNVGLLAALGVGYENIPIEYARRRGIALANGAGTNSACVADHAFALLLGVVRAIPFLDANVRRGAWRDGIPMQPNVSGKRLGIVGLGSIGAAVARRAAGFDMEVAYHNRRPRPDSALRYFDDLLQLAAWADYLVVATPGGPGTARLINADVLSALGPRGYVVNVARGSVVDTDALVAALHQGGIAGAALDVYEGEPALSRALDGAPRLVLTPHVAGRSPESMRAMFTNFIENARRHFAGQPLLTPL